MNYYTFSYYLYKYWFRVKVKKNNFTYTDLEMFERKRYDGKKKVNVIKDGLLISFEIIRGFLLLYFK